MGEDFAGRLLSGERILWEGRPQTGILFYPRDALMIPFSLMLCGFAIFWEYGVINIDHRANRGAGAIPDFMALWGVPFVLIGLYFVFGRFLHDAWARARTRYAVTNQRVLILRLSPFSRFLALAINRLPELSLEEKADGRGTIRFSPSQPIWGARGASLDSWTPALASTPQLLMVSDARNVFDRIQKLSNTPS